MAIVLKEMHMYLISGIVKKSKKPTMLRCYS